MKILFLFACFCIFAFAKQAYILNEKVDLLDPQTKKIIGLIYEGSKVEVLEEQGDYTFIEVKGEVVDNDTKSLAFKKNGIYTILKLHTQNASAQMNFWVKSTELTTDLMQAYEEVELAYYDTCTSCHAAHKPKEHMMDEWEGYLSAMQGFAKINDEEKARLLRFLQAHASDGLVSLE